MEKHDNKKVLINSHDDDSIVITIYDSNSDTKHKARRIGVIKERTLNEADYDSFVNNLYRCVNCNDNEVDEGLNQYLNKIMENKRIEGLKYKVQVKILAFALLITLLYSYAIYNEMLRNNKAPIKEPHDPKKVYGASFNNLSFTDYFILMNGHQNDNYVYDDVDYQDATAHMKQVLLDKNFDSGELEAKTIAYVELFDYLSSDVRESLKHSEVANNEDLEITIRGALIRMHKQGVSLLDVLGSNSIDRIFFNKLNGFRERMMKRDNEVGKEFKDYILALRDGESIKNVSTGALFIGNWEIDYLLDLAIGSGTIGTEDYLSMKLLLDSLHLEKKFIDSNKENSISYVLEKKA